MKNKSKGSIRNAGTLTLIFLIFTMSLGPAFAKERKHGKELTIQKKDGEIIRGELIAVKNNSLLLDSNSSSENSIDIRDISAITIINKSQFWSGAGIGFLSGTAFGMGIGFASGNDKPGFMSHTAGEKAMLIGPAFGIIFGTLGGIFGAAAGIDDTIKIKETGDPNKIAKLLGELRSLARYPDEK